MNATKSKARVQREIRHEGFLTNLASARKYAITAARYADQEGRSEAHRCLMAAITSLDDAKEAGR